MGGNERRDETRRGQGREHRRPIRVSRFCNLSGQSVDGRLVAWTGKLSRPSRNVSASFRRFLASLRYSPTSNHDAHTLVHGPCLERASHSVLVATSTRTVTPNLRDFYLSRNVSLSLSPSHLSSFYLFLDRFDRYEDKIIDGPSHVVVDDKRAGGGKKGRLARIEEEFWIDFWGSDHGTNGGTGGEGEVCVVVEIVGEAVLRGGGGGGGGGG